MVDPERAFALGFKSYFQLSTNPLSIRTTVVTRMQNQMSLADTDNFVDVTGTGICTLCILRTACTVLYIHQHCFLSFLFLVIKVVMIDPISNRSVTWSYSLAVQCVQLEKQKVVFLSVLRNR